MKSKLLGEIKENFAPRSPSPPAEVESGTGARTDPERVSWGQHLESVVLSYADVRRISGQQLVVLRLYLQGKNDKEIADLCSCSGATVYKYWHRMAKKSGGSFKSDVVADFHRFLAGD